MYRGTLWETNTEYMPLSNSARHIGIPVVSAMWLTWLIDIVIVMYPGLVGYLPSHIQSALIE